MFCHNTHHSTTNHPPHKNQTAHEVTRDVTAWAYQFAFRPAPKHRSFCFPTSGLGPMFSASSSRPGPASARSAWARCLAAFAHTDGFPQVVSCGRSPNWGGEAVSRLDGRGISLSIAAPAPITFATGTDFHDLPDPVPRIAGPSPHLQCSSGPLGPTQR